MIFKKVKLKPLYSTLILIILCTLCFGLNQRVVVSKVYIVDRIEENLVVIEWDCGHFKIPKDLFHLPVKEGDVLKISIDIDHDATKSRRNRIKDLLQFDEY
ncbi:MAG: DUF3006 domain-containing protein [Firmicutes bacterium]|nr:DUF3006 domain-containing protein [Bacillota bacterium]MDD4263221.1 DUF3006 domain-containing protein [Bacillota bacterium]MDD4693673.1 DUF3006 domain-containing protein [Bacillota bacterium]